MEGGLKGRMVKWHSIECEHNNNLKYYLRVFLVYYSKVIPGLTLSPLTISGSVYFNFYHKDISPGCEE